MARASHHGNGGPRHYRATRNISLTTVSLLAVIAIAFIFQGGCAKQSRLTAKQVLEKSVANLLALKCYRYTGTSSLTVADDPRLDNSSTFETVLVQNGQGGLDGHMVVKSPDFSYETYGFKEVEYTRVEGADWTRTAKGPGYGMVSTDARKIIAEFADLVDDVKIESETPEAYKISMVMGERYRQGAAAIVGSQPSSPAPAAADGGTRMTLVVRKKDLQMTSVFMSNTQRAGAATPAMTIVTEGTYSDFDEPRDVSPPPDALNSCLGSNP
ncbi:MAG: hypothetical protein ACYC99_14325 [Candidatus Geothermincolia bacterium]